MLKNIPLTPMPARGISLAEIVVALSLIGILGAFAVPRFTRIANSARASEVVALTANLRSTAQFAHAQYLAAGSRPEAIALDRKSIRLRNGYPDASNGGIRNLAFDLDGFTITATDNAVIFAKSDAPAAAQCSVTYRAATTAADAASVEGLDTRGC